MPSQAQDSMQGTLRFGVYEADLRSGELRKHGLRVPLEEKPFQALVILLRHPNEVVTREEFRHQLWPADVFIDFPHSLNTVVAKARRALNDSAEKPRFIGTVGRHGYRFIEKVAIEGPKTTAPAAPAGLLAIGQIATGPAAPAGDTKSPHRRKLLRASFAVLATSIVLLAFVAGIFNPWSWRDALLGRPRHAIRSLAVLPFEKLSGDPS